MMKMKVTTVLAIGIAAVYANAEDVSPALKTTKDKVSYSMGVDIGKNWKRQGIEIDAELLARGLKDAMSGDKLLMSEDEMRQTAMAFQEEMKQKQTKMAGAKTLENKKEGDAFLAKHKTEADVVTLPSGLQYKILKAGEGKKPVATDAVECNYKGTLIDGTEFDSSYRRGQPATFKVSGVIPGWTEALQLMPVGSKWQLVIPSELAYGARGAGGQIGPNAVLIFEIELLAIK